MSSLLSNQWLLIINFLLLLTISVSQTTEFTIDIAPENGKIGDEIALYSGVYTAVNIILTPLTSDIPWRTTVLKLSLNDQVTSLTQQINVDTSLSLVYKTYIGWKCGSDSPVDTTFTGKFVPSDATKFESNTFTARVASWIQSVKVEVSGTRFPWKGYGAMIINSDIKNIDDIEFEISSANSLLKSTALKYRKFTGYKDPRYGFSKFYVESNSEIISLKITITSKNQCFRPETTEYAVSFLNSVNVSDTADMIISASKNLADAGNELVFDIKSAVENTWWSCVILPNTETDIPADNTILSQPEWTDHERMSMRYFRFFYSSQIGGLDKKFHFYGWHKKFIYKMKCLYHNNAVSNPTETVIEAKFVDKLSEPITPSLKAHCGNWFIKSYQGSTTKQSLKESWKRFCIKTLYSNENNRNVDYLENGCIHCEERIEEDYYTERPEDYINIITVCVRGSPTCESSNNKADAVYKAFYEATNTTEWIKANWNENVVLDTIVTESDRGPEVNDWLNFVIILKTWTSRAWTVTISNYIGVPYNCYFDIVQGFKWDDQFGDQFILIKEGILNYTYPIDWPADIVEYDDKLYSIDLKCRILPGIEEATNHMTWEIPFTFSNYSKICYDGASTPNDLCWKYDVNSLPTLEEPVEKEDQSQEIATMKGGNIIPFYIFMQIYESIEDTGIIPTWKLAAEIWELTTNFQSTQFNYVINSNRKSSVWLTVIEKWTAINIPETATDEFRKEAQKYWSLCLFYLTNTADGFKNFNKTQIQDWSKLLIEQLKMPFMKDVKTETGLNDVYLLSSAFLGNLKQLFSYLEVQGFIDGIDTNTGYITDAAYLTLRQGIRDYLFMCMKHKLSLKYDKVHWYVKEIAESGNDSLISLDDFNVQITLPLGAIAAKVPSKLLGVGAIMFSDNPFVSYKQKKVLKQSLSLHVFSESGEVDLTGINTQHNGKGDYFIVKFKIDSTSNADTKPYCYRYDPVSKSVVYDGVITEYIIDNDSYVKCYSDTIGEIFLGYLDKHGQTREANEIPSVDANKMWFIIFIVILVIALLCGVGYFIFMYLQKRKNEKTLAEVDNAGAISFSKLN